MLNIWCSKSVEAAKAYFKNSFSKGDYYCGGHEQEIIGDWFGRGAEKLGLTGKVDGVAFCKLCDNINPVTDERLTQRTKADRRPGFDLTFDVPKSVSVLHGVTGDNRILEAFRQAVRETMEDIEQDVATRVRVDGHRDTDRKTGNIIAAEYIHLTTRPVDGYPDPQLHAHVYVANATFDPVEERWKALQMGDVKEEGAYYQSRFHSRVAAKLEDLGYKVTRRGLAFEIDGVPDSVIATFSRRTEVIEAYAAEHGITDPEEKAKLGALTRESKIRDLTMEELKVIWVGQLSLEERRVLEELVQRAKALCQELDRSQLSMDYTERLADPQLSRNERPALTPEQLEAVQQAIRHCFATESVVSQKQFEAAVLRFGIRDVRLWQVPAILEQAPELVRANVKGRALVTTRQVLREEHDLIDWVRNTRGTQRPLAPGHVIRDQRLGDDQRAAIRHVLESTDLVTGIEGRAGVGKTSAMREVVDATESHGHQVMVLAPTSSVARDDLRKEGYSQANTVEKWLRDEDLQRRIGPNAVWWVEEAGMLSVPDMVRLAQLAKEQNARLILTGDTRQHRAVARGDALAMLKTHAGLSLAVIDTVRRQKDKYKEAVEDFSNERLFEGFKKLEEMDSLHILPIDRLYTGLAQKYVELLDSGRNPLVLSPTNQEIRQATVAIRQQLKKVGQLQNEETVETLRPIHMTDAEKRDVRSFRPGQVLETMEPAPGFKAGERITVLGRGTDLLHVGLSNGRRRNLDPAVLADRFEVYQPESIPIGDGDRVQITRNGISVGDNEPLHNRTVHTVLGFNAAGDIRLTDGRIIDRNFKHFTWGHAVTSYVGQGKTVDTVLVAESSDSFGAASREQFYVSISRGMVDPHVYTDTEDLFDAVSRSSRRMAAVDMEAGMEADRLQELARQQEHVEKRERQELKQSLGQIPANVRFVGMQRHAKDRTIVLDQAKLHVQLGIVKQAGKIRALEEYQRKPREREPHEQVMEL